MWLYFVIFFIIAFFCYVDIKQKNIVVLALTILLILIAGFSGPISQDYNNYISSYNEVINGRYRTDFSFIVISKIVHLIFNNPLYLFLIYAILGVSLKISAIKKLSQFWFFSILIYFSYSFLLHEMTQIRAGVASAFVLLSIPSIYEKKLKSFLLYAGVAIFFHYSALVLLPFYF